MVSLTEYKRMDKEQLIEFIEQVTNKLYTDKNLLVEQSDLNLLKQEELVQLVLEFEASVYVKYPDEVKENRVLFDSVFRNVIGKKYD